MLRFSSRASHFRKRLIGLVCLCAFVTSLLIANLYYEASKTERNQETAVTIGRTYGEILWRVAAALRWIIEYQQAIALAEAKQVPVAGHELSFVFFVQNLNDVTSVNHAERVISKELLSEALMIIQDANATHEKLAESPIPSQEILGEISELKSRVEVITAEAGTFRSLYAPTNADVLTSRDASYSVVSTLLAITTIIGFCAVFVFWWQRALKLEMRESRTQMENLGSLSAGYSHMTSSVIASMKICLDSLVYTQTEEQRELITTLRDGISTMSSLNTSLSLAARGAPKDDRRMSVTELFTSIRTQTSHLNEKGSINFLETDAGSIMVPGTATKTILSEIITNSATHGGLKTETTVTARARRNRSSVIFEIEDNGTGFDKGIIETAKQPFVSTGTTPNTGLGLTACDSVTKQIGGNLTIANRAEGGARVTVLVPAAQKPQTNRVRPDREVETSA